MAGTEEWFSGRTKELWFGGLTLGRRLENTGDPLSSRILQTRNRALHDIYQRFGIECALGFEFHFCFAN